MFYLSRCKHGSQCKYAHDYLLEEEHYAEMKTNAKKAPCPSVNKGPQLMMFRIVTVADFRSMICIDPGELCTWGEDCCYGHTCPFTTKCHFFKLRKCKFIGGVSLYPVSAASGHPI